MLKKYREFTYILTEEGFGDDTPYRALIISPDGTELESRSMPEIEIAERHAKCLIDWIWDIQNGV